MAVLLNDPRQPGRHKRKDGFIKTRAIKRAGLKEQVKALPPKDKRRIKAVGLYPAFGLSKPNRSPYKVLSIEDKIKQIQRVREKRNCVCKRAR